MVCVVLGTIKYVIGGNDWWYHVKLRVIDETDSATFFLFYRDCYSLTKMTCSDLIAEMDREEEPTIVLRVIGGFVDQTFLFKIDVKNYVNSGFEQSFHVKKKVCVDQDIIAKFKFVAKNSTGLDENLTGTPVQNELADGIVQDLSSKFDNVGVEEKCEDNGSVSTHIEVVFAFSTPVKRGIAQVAGDIDGANTRIRKNIKIEKD
ncbi:hypothetical protein RYX36_004978 [Vicia faba]